MAANRSVPTAAETIRQTRPFASREQEALITLLLAAEAVKWPIADFLARTGDVTMQQYNVLRILRGAEPDGLPVLEIGARMVERTPGVTRLLDRLEARGLVVRSRSGRDRRQVICRISKAGAKLLSTVDAQVDGLDAEPFAGLTAAEVRTLTDLLNRVRAQAAR